MTDAGAGAEAAVQFQVLDIVQGDVPGSSESVYHVFGRDMEGKARHVRVHGCPSTITVGLPRNHPLVDAVFVQNWADTLNRELLQAVKRTNRCQKSRCTCENAVKADPLPTDAFVSVDTGPCLSRRKEDTRAVRDARVVMAKSMLGYYPKAHQFIEFELTRPYYVRLAFDALYRHLDARGWLYVPECEVYNVHTDAVMQFMCGTAALPGCAEQTLGGGRWVEVPAASSNGRVHYNQLRVVDRVEHAPVHVLAFDLECDFQEGNSVPEKNPIVSISAVWWPGGDETKERAVALTWARGEIAPAPTTPGRAYELRRFDTEMAMLRGFEQLVAVEVDPDILAGYNSDSFDFNYLYRRAQVLGAALRLGRLRERPSFMFLKETYTNQTGVKRKGLHYLPGRVSLDVLGVVEANRSLPEYNLAFVSRELLGETTDGKMDMAYTDIHPFFYHGTPEQKQHLFEYNVHDSRLVLRLMRELKATMTITSECKIVGVLMKQYLAQGKQVRILRLMSDIAHRFGYMMPKHRRVKRVPGRAPPAPPAPPPALLARREPDSDSDSDEEQAPQDALQAALQAAPAPPARKKNKRKKPEPEYDFAVPLFGTKLVCPDSYDGAVVLDPRVGFHQDWVAVLDFTSLYPNVMRVHNLCMSTLLVSREDGYAKGLTDADMWEGPPALEIGGVKHRFLFVRKETVVGVLPRVLTILLDERARIKKAMKTAPPELKEVYNTWQNAVKVVANSVYGATGAPTGPIFCIQVAATVTATGRQTILSVKNHVETVFQEEVVYGDTDSIMFKMREATSAEDAARLAQEYAQALNASGLFTNPMQIAFECVYTRFLILSPKIYAAYKYAPGDPPKLQQKGTVSIKRDNCKFVRDTYARLMDMLMMQNAPVDTMLAMVRARMQELLLGEAALEDVVMTRKLSKRPEQYAPGAGNAHVHVAVRWQKEQPATAPRVGDRVRFLVAVPPVWRAGNGLYAVPPYCVESGVEVVDWAYYAERLQTPLAKVLDAVLVDRPEEVRALFDHARYARIAGPRRIVRPLGLPPVEAPKRQRALVDVVRGASASAVAAASAAAPKAFLARGGQMTMGAFMPRR